MKIIEIETELGNELLQQLKENGWEQVKQYSTLAFDKGIDFDSYSLKKENLILEFEWSNWFEWEIRGSESALKELAKNHFLKLEYSKN